MTKPPLLTSNFAHLQVQDYVLMKILCDSAVPGSAGVSPAPKAGRMPGLPGKAMYKNNFSEVLNRAGRKGT